MLHNKVGEKSGGRYRKASGHISRKSLGVFKDRGAPEYFLRHESKGRKRRGFDYLSNYSSINPKYILHFS